MRCLRKKGRLNNKGFTLIELLAVVVILAVVMGIALTSVLSSMNKARGGSLEDSAIRIAQAFNTKYTESLVDGNPTAIYSDIATPGDFIGYNFSSDAQYGLTVALRNTFNLSVDTYVFSEGYKVENGTTTDTPETTGAVATSNWPLNATTKVYTKPTTAVDSINKSFVAFDSNEATFLVCLVANASGSYYVNNYTVGNTNNSGSPIGVVFDGVTYKFSNDVMFACSNGVTSWKKTTDTSLYVIASSTSS